MDDQVVAGARDAAKELGYEITASAVSHDPEGGTVYGFKFDADGRAAAIEFLINPTNVARFGLTIRDYARWEILDGLRGRDG